MYILAQGILLRSATERIDESPSGKLVEGMLAAVAEYDNEVRKERVKIAMWRRVDEGLWPWKAPGGYWRPKEPGVRLSVSKIDEACKDAFIRVFTLFSTSVYTFSAFSKEMNKLHVKDRDGNIIKFSKQYVQKIITNPFYAGLLTNQHGKLIKGQHEALISVALWNKCQGVIKHRSNNAVNKRLYNNPDFPLRRFVLCGKCDKPLTACWSTSGSGNRHAYYYCRNKKCKKYSEMIHRSVLHHEFGEYLKKIKPKEEFVKLFEQVFIKRYQDRKHEVQDEYLRRMDTIAELEKQRKWVVEKGMKGVLSDEMVKKQLDEIENKLALSKLELAESHQEEVEIDELIAYGIQFIRTAELAWYDSVFEAKIKYQRLIFPRGVKYHFSGYSNEELGLPFRLISDFASKKATDVGEHF